MANATVETSILILCKNEQKRIGACLEMIYKQDYASSFEVIVVDSGSTDRTLEIVRDFPVRLFEIPAHEFHHARTRNLAAENALGRYLVYVTADAVPADERWLRILIEELKPPEVAGSYGRQLPWQDAYPMEKYFLGFLYGDKRRVQRHDPTMPLDMETTLFSNVTSAIKRELWQQVPWSDAVPISEDQAWSRQMLLAGHMIVYNPDAAVYHCHNYTLKQAYRRFYQSGESSYDSYLPSGPAATLRFLANSARFVLGEVSYLVRNGYARWLPYALVYEGAKYAGLMAGRRAERHRAAAKHRNETRDEAAAYVERPSTN